MLENGNREVSRMKTEIDLDVTVGTGCSGMFWRFPEEFLSFFVSWQVSGNEHSFRGVLWTEK